ncbi:MAG: FRG domain-containing protein [Prevotella sp.]|nr:FRG domain-containing protein [Prevotella sp.]
MINEQTTYIKNVSEFTNWAMSLKESEGEITFPLLNVFFRGHASEKWNLQPGLFRKNAIHEHEIFLTAANRCWSETASFSNLEKLIYFQHYGLRTRLLDVTSNPLVALYFACQEYNGDDGQVRYGYYDPCGIEIVKIMADVIAKYDIGNNHPGDSWFHELVNKCELRSHEILKKQLSRPYYVNAPFNSQRIIAQRGAFLIAPLFRKMGSEYFYADNYDFDSDKENSMFGKRNVVIKSEHKHQILDELHILGVDEASMFPDTSHILSAINGEQFSPYENLVLAI